MAFTRWPPTRIKLGRRWARCSDPAMPVGIRVEDHVTVIDRCLAQIPPGMVEPIELLIRADTAGCTHGLVDYWREAGMRFSVGHELTGPVRAAILQTPDTAWVAALDQDDTGRENGQVVEITEHLELSGWPEGARVIVRRERPTPARS
jgi:hypothetical protein